MQYVHFTLLGLLIFFAGLTAGQMYHEMVGAQEALYKVDDKTYITYWKSIDGILAVRMPIAANFLFLIFIATLVVFRTEYKSSAYILLIVSLLCFVAETIVTVKLQLPINHLIQAIDLKQLPSDFKQLKSDTFNLFIIRAILRYIGFILLIFSALSLIILTTKPIGVV